MCGVVGIYSHKPVAQDLYDSLIHLQHRGQDAAGILTYDGKFHQKKGLGLVRDIFQEHSILRLKGHWGIGHTRYPTAGGFDIEDSQPFWVSDPYGMALAHNGNLINCQSLKKDLQNNRQRYLNSTCDAEVLLNILADELHKNIANDGVTFFDHLCAAVESLFKTASGAYSVVGMVIGKGMFAFRDDQGIRPLCCGMRTNPDGTRDYIFASENTMFYALGFKFMGNVQPGEVIFVNEAGEIQSRILGMQKQSSLQEKKKLFTPCIFEYVYFARPDSMLNNVSVYRARLRMGQNLAKQWQQKHPDILPDIVIPAPATSNTAALAMAHELGVRYSEGLYKNPFIGRTFIMPGQEIRKKSVRYKLNPQETEIRDKKVMILDDSVVRGTTSKEIVKMMREFGAKEVYFVVACPPVKFPCFYGVDIPTKTELIAARQSEEEIRQFIGADILLYQTIDDLVEAVTRRGEHNIDRPCLGCLDGFYITGDIDDKKMEEMEEQRNKERQNI